MSRDQQYAVRVSIALWNRVRDWVGWQDGKVDSIVSALQSLLAQSGGDQPCGGTSVTTGS